MTPCPLPNLANHRPMPFKYLFVSAILLLSSVGLSAAPTQIKYLSGTGSDDTVNWEFRVNGGRNSNVWSHIPVPSNWEMEGFGSYNYWRDWGEDLTDDTLAHYRHSFILPKDWKEQTIRIFFGGSMTDTTVTINGHLAGPTHQGGFYQFSYDITDLVDFSGPNTLEVEVRKISDNRSVNLAEREADFWLFGGIYRPVWLEAKPRHHIEHLALDPRHTGELAIELQLSPENPASRARIQIFEHGSNKPTLSKTLELTAGAPLTLTAPKVKPWTAETPHLYDLKLTLLDGKSELHTIHQTFGFRTIEVRPKDGIYVNGSRVILKGTNRHTIWPTSGRASNRSLSYADAALMKEMNNNAVRMSHYPPDPHFLEACDELGLYVIDELTGWQKSYDAEVGAKLVVETVRRDVNHPSVILWANGNEGGWNTELDDDFAKLDPQKRTVIHPWDNFNGIETSHYESYNAAAGSYFQGDDILMPTEFLHALYDGGAAAGLDDWWNAILHHPAPGGGFIWAFADEGIVRDDQDGQIDVAKNRAPDGVVGPYREKEGSFLAIKEIWAPIYLPLAERDRLPESFDGSLLVENRYDHTDLRNVTFNWILSNTADSTAQSGEAEKLSLEPWLTGRLNLHLPSDWQSFDLLSLTATNPDGNEIYTWRWMLKGAADLASRRVTYGSGSVNLNESGDSLIATAGDSQFSFDRFNGQLVSASLGTVNYPLSFGPKLLDQEIGEYTVSTESTLDYVKVESRSESNLQSYTWTLYPSGWLKLDYRYNLDRKKTYPYIGIGFEYDESKVSGIQYLGKGPYRVWNNRRKGVETSVWEKAYNDTATGSSWVYPEFKGYHEDLYWATLRSAKTPITIVSATDDLFLGLFKPAQSPDPVNSWIDYPDSDLSFLHAVSPIGTKFHPASNHGPQGQKHIIKNRSQGFSGTLYFHLDEPE